VSERILRALLQFVSDEQSKVRDALANGAAKDFPAYQHLVGYAGAMTTIQQFLNAKERETEND
jgi:hypothetical protein